eukprot:2754139-Pyramimonas_sp.AAC.1
MRACTCAERAPSLNALSNPSGTPGKLFRTLLKRSDIAADPLPAQARCCEDRGAAEMGCWRAPP